jgi:nucleotide-binding universal stress UspA family protein
MRAHRLTGDITAVFCGKPAELIVEVAKKEEVSQIVMGTRGSGVLRRTLMGSISDYVLHHAHCPVTVCAHPHHGKKRLTSMSSGSSTSSS